MHGPQVPFSDKLHAQKYRGEGESFREAVNRISNALSDDTQHFKVLRNILLNMRFMPAGRVQAAMGSIRTVTPYNCFLSGIIEDSFVDGVGSIMARAAEGAATMRMGGGIGYDFSTLRPRGATIKKLQSRSSGPVSFMEIYDAVCRCISSTGHRRGAQMGVMRVDHPDIEEFIRAKQNTNRLTRFNMSVAVTDQFMDHLLEERPFPLRFGNEVYKEIDPCTLWETLMRSTWDWGEPGVLFIDHINAMNNLWYCETIAATNPCGEQPLPPHGACLLGSFNLVKYADVDGFDYDQFALDVAPVVRAMDNVIDKAGYPLYEQEKEAKSKRRMGLGVTGLANALERMGLPYGSDRFLEVQRDIIHTLRDEAYVASCQLAVEKGSFPLFHDEAYLKSEFTKMLPERTRFQIQHAGIRNSHLLSIAPTGTISMCADNVSSGIEPVTAYTVDRTIFMDDEPQVFTIEDYGRREFGIKGKTVQDVTVAEHLAVLTTAAPCVDSAVSKTCNVPSNTPWATFKDIYVQAWKAGCKGCTTYQMGGKRPGILSIPEDDSQPELEDVCHIDPESGQKECE